MLVARSSDKNVRQGEVIFPILKFLWVRKSSKNDNEDETKIFLKDWDREFGWLQRTWNLNTNIVNTYDNVWHSLYDILPLLKCIMPNVPAPGDKCKIWKIRDLVRILDQYFFSDNMLTTEWAAFIDSDHNLSYYDKGQ